MKRFSRPLSPELIQKVTGGSYAGAPDLVLNNVAEPQEADAGSVIFWEQEKYQDAVEKSSAGLVICLPAGVDRLPGRNLLITDKPYFALMSLVSWWLQQEPGTEAAGIHPSALVAEDVAIPESASVASGASIASGCRIGEKVAIGAGCRIGENVIIGPNTRLYPNVSIYADTVIGSNVIIHSGAVIGADGFGFLLLNGIQQKIPQIGNVRIGDWVEIGANSTIDRATLGSTVVGEGTKIDNLVQIGHNCVIGKHCILCAHVGLAGSTVLGDYVYLAGQVGVAGHLTIGDRAMVGAQSGVTNDIPPDGRYIGSPAEAASIMKRVMISQKYLPEMYRFYQQQLKTKPDKG
jgi:UDP-3-O-[3-hydroxymyristoyl] glucosamine N-acyltransferase